MNQKLNSTTRILFISNGHGEDLNGSLIAQSLRSLEDNFSIDSFPLVGEGKSYHHHNIPIVSPVQPMPSGGIFYLNPLNFLQDLGSGLIALTLKQIITLNQSKQNYDFVVAVGDVVPLIFAYLTGKQYVSFIVSTSSYYEGRLKLPWLTKLLLRSSRCQAVFTRDQYTAQDLQQQGLSKAMFAGYPIMDTLKPTGQNLSLSADIPMLALVPGSRLPEALRNLQLQLQVVEKLVSSSPTPWHFRAALVPSISDDDLGQIATELGWTYENKALINNVEERLIEVRVYSNAFADILRASNLVLGMAGTAVEQAVGLGKPVVQIPGKGPQFTYRFAEAQMRLLGANVMTIDDHQEQTVMFQQAATTIMKIFNNQDFLAQCIDNGQERVGKKGGSLGIAQQINWLINQKK